MADFAAVLKKTLDGMNEPGADVRAKVYERARATIARQIEAMPKRPSDAAIQRQYEKLDAAIDEVEATYGEPSIDEEIAAALPEDPRADDAVGHDPDPEAVDLPAAGPIIEEIAPEPEPEPFAGPVISQEDDELENEREAEPDERAEAIDEIFADEPATVEDTVYDTGMTDGETVMREDGPPEAVYEEERDPADAYPEDAYLAEPGHGPEHDVMAPGDTDPLAAYLAEQEAESHDEAERQAVAAISGITADEAADKIWEAEGERRDDYAGGAAYGAAGRPKRRVGGLIIALLLLLLIGSGGYAAYVYEDDIMAFFTGQTSSTDQTDVADQGEPAEAQQAEENSQTTEDGLPVRAVPSTTVTMDDTDTTPDEPSTEIASNDSSGDGSAEAPEKFTQRLTAGGEEIDEGPANVPRVTGEGTSVAGQSADAGTTTQTEPDTETSTATAAEDDAPLPVGQRAIFYQERTGAQAGTAEAGAVIWSVVQESPGDGMPPEPAIRAEASIPDLGLTMEMTIRRDADETFPASHVIEIFFRVPDTFEGRGIADVQRVTFKGTEQDPGNALIGVAAALDTNIFLIALTDANTAIETNLNLMRREDWIDIPMQYVSGRRALITLEKGIPGEQVFKDVLSAWEEEPLPEEAPADSEAVQ